MSSANVTSIQRFGAAWSIQLLRIALLLLTLPVPGNSGCLVTYSFNNGAITFIRSSGGCVSVTIPDAVRGLPVTSIADRAFYGCTNLSNVIIGNSVATIGDWAFSGCTSLTSIYFRGNAPSLGASVFEGANNVIVYYLPGTAGWGATYGGRPTAVWCPQIQTRDTGFGVHTNQFAFNIAWASGMNIAVDASTDLVNPTWLPLQTNTMASDTFYCSDPDWTNSPRRFYRVRWP